VATLRPSRQVRCQCTSAPRANPARPRRRRACEAPPGLISSSMSWFSAESRAGSRRQRLLYGARGNGREGPLAPVFRDARTGSSSGAGPPAARHPSVQMDTLPRGDIDGCLSVVGSGGAGDSGTRVSVAGDGSSEALQPARR
jgi:hypothetical protein